MLTVANIKGQYSLWANCVMPRLLVFWCCTWGLTRMKTCPVKCWDILSSDDELGSLEFSWSLNGREWRVLSYIFHAPWKCVIWHLLYILVVAMMMFTCSLQFRLCSLSSLQEWSVSVNDGEICPISRKHSESISVRETMPPWSLLAVRTGLWYAW